MLLKDKQIAIVGGGPGGLTLARLLQLRGARVQVYERDADRRARQIGSPLDMHDDSGMAALREANLLDALRKHYHPGADKKIIVNCDAEILFSDHLTKKATDFGSPDSNPEIDRPALRNMLLDSLSEGSVIWNSHFQQMQPEGEGWRLQFRNGSAAYADLVIAADGANSKIRPYITGIKAFYTGITMLEITIFSGGKSTPGIFRLLNGGKVMAFGEEQCLLGGQKSHGDLGFYAAFKTGEDPLPAADFDFNSNGALLDWFKSRFQGWNRCWDEIFEKAELPVIPRPIYCLPPDQTWTSLPNLTMIGDAAHVMPPFAGEGANTAMGDALSLCHHLCSESYAGIQEAIAGYETDMRKRASVAAKTSLENGQWMFSAGGLERMLAIARRS